MNFLKSGWNSVLGSNDPAPQSSVADTIEKLIERVETSTLIEDRRDACRALKSLAKTYRLEVGAQGMNALITVLLTDTHDNEIISYTLDALCYIITGPQEDPNDYEGIQSPKEDTEDLGIQFTEIFAKKKENVAILIDLLSETDFKVRWPALKLLTGLLRNKLRYIQDLVLDKASGIPKIMDLLQDSREIIRNDAILLLVHLTRSNSNIQKIVTFENAFDKFFDIISMEGYTDGGVVVEDCLIVCQNLLKNNSSNQVFFKEGNYIPKLLPFLDITDYINWCPQKETNVLFLLYVIRTLISPTNQSHVTIPVQKTILQSGLFSKLCEMLLTKGIPEIVLSETINTVGESIRGENFIQKHFFNLNTLVDPPKPIMVVLLMSMINEKQSFILRCAILYCFQCFLYKNEIGQAQIIQTLLPSTIEASEDVNVGQLLCSGLFSQDPISQWFVTVALSHLLIDNKAQKEQLLRVQIATDVNSVPIPLFTSCCNLLQETNRFHSKLGLLILLSTWLSNCSFAVIRFLEINTSVPFLISQISLVEGDECDMLVHGMCAFLLGICIKYNDDSVRNFTKEDILQLINKRIGFDTFVEKINQVSNHETYSSTLQKPIIKFKTIDDVILDHEYCKLFKSLETDIIKIVRVKPTDQTNPESNLTDEQHSLLIQYKDLIRDQDSQITHLRKELIDSFEKLKTTQNELNEAKSNLEQLKDENALLKQTINYWNTSFSSNDNFNANNLPTYFSNLNVQHENPNNYNYVNSYNYNSHQNCSNQNIENPAINNQYYAFNTNINSQAQNFTQSSQINYNPVNIENNANKDISLSNNKDVNFPKNTNTSSLNYQFNFEQQTSGQNFYEKNSQQIESNLQLPSQNNNLSLSKQTENNLGITHRNINFPVNEYQNISPNFNSIDKTDNLNNVINQNTETNINQFVQPATENYENTSTSLH